MVLTRYRQKLVIHTHKKKKNNILSIKHAHRSKRICKQFKHGSGAPVWCGSSAFLEHLKLRVAHKMSFPE